MGDVAAATNIAAVAAGNCLSLDAREMHQASTQREEIDDNIWPADQEARHQIDSDCFA